MNDKTKEIFCAPWWIDENKEDECYDVYNAMNDRIMSGIETRENAEAVCALPDFFEALKQIEEMEPGTSCDTDDGCSYYTSECGNCDEMIAIAREALKKAGVEE